VGRPAICLELNEESVKGFVQLHDANLGVDIPGAAVRRGYAHPRSKRRSASMIITITRGTSVEPKWTMVSKFPSRFPISPIVPR
jgi:hypothetical protein